ncbi:MAG: VWA domain-containing protein [archaeon]|nr:VWA domain-containing protein [archaeon]
MKQKKGLIFTMDALMAISLLLIATGIVFSQGTTRLSGRYLSEQANTLSEDSIKIISNIEFSCINETLRNNIISDTNVSTGDLDKDLVYVIGELWAENSADSMSYARQLTQIYVGELIPEGYNYGLYVNDREIYSDPKGEYSVLSASRRMISGIHEGMPTKGTSTRISISNILSKDTAKFIYFGGFVGEGNITKIVTLPDAIGSVINVYIEMDAGSNFTMSVNGNYAGTYAMGSATAMYSNNWTMNSTYYSLFNANENTIQINFTEMQNSYIGGGYIKIEYNTSRMDTTMINLQNGNVSERYDFPGINGFINLYSSFYVQGILNSMHVHLHLDIPYTTYLYIGKTKVYQNRTNETQYIDINNTVLSSMLNYGAMSENTIPIRLGIKNITGMSEGSDVVEITDLSGSMDTFDVQPGNQERIAVAKECAKDFVDTILNNEDQRVGLIGYGTSTDNGRTVYLTEDNATLKAMITGYDHDQGGTCISCGIASSTAMLLTTINITTIVDNGTIWRYNDSYLDAEPPDDSFGYRWYEPNYSLESEWSAGNAVFGAGAGSIPIVTALATGGINGNISYVDLWDDNLTTIPVSFETGYNSTANTFGWNNGDDGWDYDAEDDSGPYGYDDNIDYNLVVNEMLEFDTRTSAAARNMCDNHDCSGAYGIQVNITQEQYDILFNNGMARVSFRYEWDDNDADPFESADEVWIKCRWTSPTTGIHYLGTEQSSEGGDTTPEIDYRNNPDIDIPLTDTIHNVTSWIEGPGIYYLDIGGKLSANHQHEWGYFRFDDILLEIRNGTSAYYFRKNFTVDDMGKVGRGFLKVVSDDLANIYLNGELIDADPGPSHYADYWNRIELIDRSYFREGNNTIAARLYNSDSTTRFDLRLEIFNESRNKAMLVMSDGDANTCPGACPPEGAKQQAIDFACYAYENYGIISHAVGFGAGADNATLRSIADCGRGMFRVSGDAEELKQIYRDIASAMISFNTQKADITGTYTITTLYPDSYIEYNYTPTADLDYGEISLTFDSATFGETSGNPNVESPKNGSYWIPPSVGVVDAKATSYSSEFWTSVLNMKNETSGWTNVYNLSTYQERFTKLGDPYIVFMPPALIGQNQTNYVQIDTGINETYFTGGSPHSKVIYTLKIKGTASYSKISPKADGCEWNVEQYNGENATIKIPTNYNGTKNCEFSSAQIIYDHDDSIDCAAILLLQQLDVTGDNMIDIALDQTNIDIRIIKVTDIPWMWGPAILKLEIWK